MKTYKFLLALCVLTLFSCKTDAENNTSTDRQVSGYDAISVSTGLNVVLIQSQEEGIKMIGEQKDIEDVVAEVKGSCLKLYFKSKLNLFHSHGKVIVEIKFKNMKAIELSSGSSCNSSSKMSLADLKVDQSSGSNLNIDLSATSVKIDMSSGSNATLIGEAQSIKIDQSSGSNLNAIDFSAKKVDVDMSSGSDCKITVLEELGVDLSSGASLKYKGTPKMYKTEISSGGSLKRIE